MFSKYSFSYSVVKSWDCMVELRTKTEYNCKIKLQNHNSSELFIKRQNFRLLQIESMCRQQNKCASEIEICYRMSKKHCGKRR